MNRASFFTMIIEWCKARGREFWAEDTSPRQPLRDEDREKEWRALEVSQKRSHMVLACMVAVFVCV
ncbi:MAG: hypothetical protein SOT13_05805, partial [Candidatus Aphodousia sp.]|nr:hypothetical protein [Candidatus Aphodousia sp.]